MSSTMRLLAAAVLLLVSACAEAKLPPPKEGARSCEASDRAACTSGPLVCGYDEKNDCNLCKCKSEVF